KSVDASGHIEGTLDRTKLRTVQTPQVFAFAPVLDAHRRAATTGREDFTDDAALAEWAGLKVAAFAGEAGNLKLTTPDDVARAARDHAAALNDTRTGSGFDVHAFADGDHVMLGGVKIPHERGVTGHSDADVALHALTDAVLGALAEGDIGSHFPPSDPQWRGASSDRFLVFAVERVRARGGRIAHLDLTIVCEAPRVGPHPAAMRPRAPAPATPLTRRHRGHPPPGEPPPKRAARFPRPPRGHAPHGARARPPAVERAVSDPEITAAATRVLDASRARGLKIATAESC